MSMRQGRIRLGAGATFERSKLRRTPRGSPKAISYQLDPDEEGIGDQNHATKKTDVRSLRRK
jgi:hypothetical protein